MPNNLDYKFLTANWFHNINLKFKKTRLIIYEQNFANLCNFKSFREIIITKNIIEWYFGLIMVMIRWREWSSVVGGFVDTRSTFFKDFKELADFLGFQWAT